MSRFKLIFAIILICIASTSCAIFEGHKKDGGPRSRFGCISGHIMAAHFIDGSGRDPDAVDNSFDVMSPYTKDYCDGFRFIIAGVSDEYISWPKNVTTCDETGYIRVWLDGELKPYRGIFDLQNSVNTFLQHPSFSSYDPQSNRPPWAVIYAYSDTVGGMNNLLNGISQLQSKGYMVLLISSQLTQHKMPQLLQVLPQSNIASLLFQAHADTWLISRYNARYTVPIVNQTGTSGYITSPNYPEKYGKWDLCDYYITAPSTSYTIVLTINHFELTEFTDYLLVYKGPMMNDDDYLHNWTGNMTVKDTKIKSNAATLRFISDGWSTHRGFNISWTAIPNPPEEKSDNSIG